MELALPLVPQVCRSQLPVRSAAVEVGGQDHGQWSRWLYTQEIYLMEWSTISKVLVRLIYLASLSHPHLLNFPGD